MITWFTTHEVAKPRISLDPIQSVHVCDCLVQKVGHDWRGYERDDKKSIKSKCAPELSVDVEAYSVIHMGY